MRAPTIVREAWEVKRVGGAEFRRLKWQTFGVATLGLVSVQVLVHLFDAHGTKWTPAIVNSAVITVAVLIFNEYVFRLIARADAALGRERQRLYALHQISEAVAFLPALERNLGASLDIVRRVTSAAVVGWMEPSAHRPEIRVRVLVGDRRSAADDGLSVRFGQGLAGRAFTSGKATVIEDVFRMRREDRQAYPLMGAEELRAGLAICAAVHQQVQGILVLGWRAPHRLSRADREFLDNVSNLLAVAVENLRLYRDTQRLAALEERERLGREMHDGLAQQLTYLKLKAEAALAQANGSASVPVLTNALDAIRRGTMDALGDVRQAILDLKGTGAPADFATHLSEYLQAWSRLNDIEAELQVPQGGVDLPGDVGFQALRVVQEALANVRKHSGAGHVRVRVHSEAGIITVSVADDGRGFDPTVASRPGHFGLSILRERAAAIGGSVVIDSQPGGGCEVLLRVPEIHRSPGLAPAASGGAH